MTRRWRRLPIEYVQCTQDSTSFMLGVCISHLDFFLFNLWLIILIGKFKVGNRDLLIRVWTWWLLVAQNYIFGLYRYLLLRVARISGCRWLISIRRLRFTTNYAKHIATYFQLIFAFSWRDSCNVHLQVRIHIGNTSSFICRRPHAFVVVLLWGIVGNFMSFLQLHIWIMVSKIDTFQGQCLLLH